MAVSSLNSNCAEVVGGFAMNIGIIGAGKLGNALAIAMDKLEFGISGIYSRSEASCQSLCGKLNLEMDNCLETVIINSDVIFLCVSDNDINSMASRIVSCLKPESVVGKVFFHLSGALSSDALKPLEDIGGYIGSFHPIQTFADKENGWQKLFGCFFGFEGCDEAKRCAINIADKLKAKVIFIRKEQKTLYHAAACMISNYTVTLFYIMNQMLLKSGIEEDAADNAFIPLLKNTVDNIEKLGYINALTGPISRADYKVIEQHIKSLSSETPEFEAVYRILGRETIDIAVSKGNLKEADVIRLKGILGE